MFPGMISSGVVSPSNTRKGSSNPGRGTGGSWYDSRWCSLTSSSVYSRSPFVYSQGGRGVYSHQRPRGGERLGGL